MLCVRYRLLKKRCNCLFIFFFLNDPATTEIYPLPHPAALPICPYHFTGNYMPFHSTLCDKGAIHSHNVYRGGSCSTTDPTSAPSNSSEPSTSTSPPATPPSTPDRKSTRLNSSHSQISYAVFCLK